MGKWDFLYEFINENELGLTIDENKAILTDEKTGAHIDIYEEEYFLDNSQEKVFVEYIVCFATQHRHFEDLSDVAEYIRMILTDEVLPIEFYLHGERRFGGEIKKTDYEGLTMEFLAGHYGYSVEYLSQFEYEVHSWSGRYNVERQYHE